MHEQLLIHGDPLQNQMVGLNYRNTMQIELQKEYFLGTEEEKSIQKYVVDVLPKKGKLLLFLIPEIGHEDSYNFLYIKVYLYKDRIYEDRIIGPDANYGQLSVYK